MENATNPDYLRNRQYRDDSNLQARRELHRRFSTNPYDWQKWAFDQLHPTTGSRVLELGGGPGWLWRTNLDRLPENLRVTFSDFSPGMLETARQHLPAATFDFLVIDAQDIPFPDATFDIVVANHMLYHVPDKARAFREIRRVLKPGGRFYAATNGDNHLRQLSQLAHRINKPDNFFNVGGSVGSFRLENGLELLSPYFSDIELCLYEDELVVTEVEPLVAYVLSTAPLSASEVEELRRIAAREIEEKGAFRIDKATGLFIAHTK